MMFVGVPLNLLDPWVGPMPLDAIIGMQTADGNVWKITPGQVVGSSDVWDYQDPLPADTTVVTITNLVGKVLKGLSRNGVLVPKIILYPNVPTGLQTQFNPANGTVTVHIDNCFSKDDILIPIWSY